MQLIGNNGKTGKIGKIGKMDNLRKLGNIGIVPMLGKLRTIGKTGKIGKIGKIGPTEAGKTTYGIRTGNHSDHPQYVVVGLADSKQPTNTGTPHTGFFGRKIVKQALTYR